MTLTERIAAFSSLGEILRDALDGKASRHTDRLMLLAETQHLNNPWFTPDNVRMAVGAIAGVLTEKNLRKWTDAYPLLKENHTPVKVAVVMAGNIPLVGFHDFLSVLISGNMVLAKTSSRDPDLIVFIRDILCDINPGLSQLIEFTESNMAGFDAVIATGSDNTSRYFDQYFGKYHHIIRKNRNSIAILSGNETAGELEALGSDVFSYFGLGCRNVSKLFVPEGYDLNMLTGCWKKYSGLVSHMKYANNYDFNKAVALVNREPFVDTGYLILKESNGISSPVAVLYYEYFSPEEHVTRKTEEMKEKIQCIIGRNHLPFGTAQAPALWDYADGTDTLEFLLKKNIAGIL